MKSKKSQMEILGLAIVIVLLILGLVFVIKFVALKKPSTIKQEVSQSELATGYLSTYLDTSVPECNGLTISELLQDCAARGGITCPSSTTILSSCEKAEEVADIIFSQTFKIWKLPYELKASFQNQELIQLGERCKGQKRSKTFPLPSRAGTIQVTLDICG